MAVGFRSFVQGGEPGFHTRGMIVSCSVYMVRHPRGSYIDFTLLSLEVATPETEQLIQRCHPYYATHSSLDLTSTSLLTCSVPALKEYEGLWSYDYGNA